MVFLDANGRATQSNSQLFWSSANNRLGIGTASPARALEVTGAGSINGMIIATNSPYNRIFSSSNIQLQSNAGSGNQVHISNEIGAALGSDNVLNVTVGGAGGSTAGTLNVQSLSGRFIPASGNQVFSYLNI